MKILPVVLTGLPEASANKVFKRKLIIKISTAFAKARKNLEGK